MTTETRFLGARDAAKTLGVSVASLWRGVAAGRLPRPFYPSPRTPRWDLQELLAALEQTRALPREAVARRRAVRLARAPRPDSA